jgi:RNA polymerase sigma factor (sigma-70 family)
MQPTSTTAAIQRYLDELAGLQGDSPAEPVVRDLLGRAADRLHALCRVLLLRSYPRLTRPPLNLQTEEMLSAVVERLIKALRKARPGNARQFFQIANQHMRWELNDLARRLDEQTPPAPMPDEIAAHAESSASQLSPVARRLFQAIDELPEEEREVFTLIRLQAMNRREVAEVLGVSVPTVQRRLNRALLELSQSIGDLRPVDRPNE